MLAAGQIDEDFAAIEHRINDDSQSVQRELVKAKEEAKRERRQQQQQQQQQGGGGAARGAPSTKEMVPDDIVKQYEEQERRDAPLIKSYLKRALAAQPRLDFMEHKVKGILYTLPRVVLTEMPTQEEEAALSKSYVTSRHLNLKALAARAAPTVPRSTRQLACRG